MLTIWFTFESLAKLQTRIYLTSLQWPEFLRHSVNILIILLMLLSTCCILFCASQRPNDSLVDRAKNLRKVSHRQMLRASDGLH